ncbi:MAG TPA: SsrA-binding protein SmpB [bacterium]|nr:SsrA-binding protein SmpB [bacterium]
MKEFGKPGEGEKNVCVNRRARHEYFVLSTVEAGIALAGCEVKSVRQGNVSLQDAYAIVEDEEAYLLNMHITPYEKSAHFVPDPKRKRKLLLHKIEIRRLVGRATEKGLTLVPLRVYIVRGRVKIEIALARGKAKRDRREEIAKRDAEREIRREAAGRG